MILFLRNISSLFPPNIYHWMTHLHPNLKTVTSMLCFGKCFSLNDYFKEELLSYFEGIKMFHSLVFRTFVTSVKYAHTLNCMHCYIPHFQALMTPQIFIWILIPLIRLDKHIPRLISQNMKVFVKTIPSIMRIKKNPGNLGKLATNLVQN